MWLWLSLLLAPSQPQMLLAQLVLIMSGTKSLSSATGPRDTYWTKSGCYHCISFHLFWKCGICSWKTLLRAACQGKRRCSLISLRLTRLLCSLGKRWQFKTSVFNFCDNSIKTCSCYGLMLNPVEPTSYWMVRLPWQTQGTVAARAANAISAGKAKPSNLSKTGTQGVKKVIKKPFNWKRKWKHWKTDHY